MQALIKRGGIDGVFCGDDILAIGAVDACRECGMSVPKDVGIVGFDDMPMASWTAYNLTTVRQPVANIIGTAIDLIISIVEEPGWSAPSQLFACEAVVLDTLMPA